VLVYIPALASTRCTHPRRDGQAELTWVAGYIPRRFTRLPTVTHPPSTNWAQLDVLFEHVKDQLSPQTRKFNHFAHLVAATVKFQIFDTNEPDFFTTEAR